MAKKKIKKPTPWPSKQIDSKSLTAAGENRARGLDTQELGRLAREKEFSDRFEEAEAQSEAENNKE